MEHTSELIIRADAAAVVPVVADLATYPHWNDLVSKATPAEPVDADEGPAWHTTLRAQVGPFARSKKLRFMREQFVEHDDDASIRFVRAEVDGRNHAGWMMRVDVEPVAGACSVTLSLVYDGALWIPALGSILHGAIESATERLPDYVAQQ